MARTANYSVLKKYLPKEQFDENYALISHYIQLQGTDKAKKNGSSDDQTIIVIDRMWEYGIKISKECNAL